MSGLLSHEKAGESPPTGPAHHYAQLLARLEDLEGYSHAVLLQYPKLERHLLCAEIRQSLNKSLRLQYINAHRYQVWSEHVGQIGRMVGGWLKAAQK